MKPFKGTTYKGIKLNFEHTPSEKKKLKLTKWVRRGR